MRKMKDSGIEWIGQIPEEWDIVRVKHAFIRKNEKAQQENPVVLSLARSGVKIRDVSNNEGQVAESYYNYNPVSVGDLLLNPMDLYSGANCSISEVEGVISPAYVNLKNRPGYEAKFYDYYFKVQYWMMVLFAHGKGVSFDNRWTLNHETLMNFPIVAPSFKEQSRIADYLDEKCGEIDRYIEKQQQIIEKLKAYKQAVITEAVTKGIRKNRPMKDSGIEWIGEIPKGWDVIISRFVIDNIVDVDHYMPESVEIGYPYVMTGDLKESLSEVDFDKCKKISSGDYVALSQKIYPMKGNVIFARYATIGTVCYVDYETECVVSYSCVTVQPSKDKLNGKFLFYYFKSQTFKEEVQQYITSNTQANIGIEAMYRSKIVVPPTDEQKRIALYLDNKCEEIDETISKTQMTIDKLSDYKKSLVYEAVTGKIEV